MNVGEYVIVAATTICTIVFFPVLVDASKVIIKKLKQR